MRHTDWLRSQRLLAGLQPRSRAPPTNTLPAAHRMAPAQLLGGTTAVPPPPGSWPEAVRSRLLPNTEALMSDPLLGKKVLEARWEWTGVGHSAHSRRCPGPGRPPWCGAHPAPHLNLQAGAIDARSPPGLLGRQWGDRRLRASDCELTEGELQPAGKVPTPTRSKFLQCREDIYLQLAWGWWLRRLLGSQRTYGPSAVVSQSSQASSVWNPAPHHESRFQALGHTKGQS